MRALVAQTRAEVFMTLRRGETLLLTVGIPVVFLVFFSSVHVVSTPHETPVDFFVPGILALAVMSTAMVSLGIATGFERGYGVLKRLGCDPVGPAPPARRQDRHRRGGRAPPGRRPGRRGLRPRVEPATHGSGSADGAAVAAVLLATAAFGGIGLFMAGVLKAEVNLAAANGLYLVLLLLGGMVVPISKLPGGVAAVAKLLPAEALSRRAARRAGHRVRRADPVLGRPRRVGRGGPGRGRAQLPLGMSFFSSAVNLATEMRTGHDGADGAVGLDEDGVGIAVEVEVAAGDGDAADHGRPGT